ncbi:gamma-glutamyl phosphate reductase [Gallibacterium salpingitidis]|uniref:Gamma-glutamyl phosphate reductase n=1 Tax=Gallibacterium salpingitidis TaxID=505341 RepID=A0AB36E5H0_9PAST|nr:glutamate-5-semialdehyde dehydrogenase [Gallibacterium salpingitidis]OBX07180.1 gamma-glutamyl phosphate reductase [Gallibacterium salpingitidis]OBX12148.1 gamma-glutamyl phosphate reductase [Gallibacterium salpingitidis]
MTDLQQLGKLAKEAAFRLAELSHQQKNAVLACIAQQLKQRQQDILNANAKDIQNAEQQGISKALIDRLMLTESRLDNIIHEVKHVISLPDPVGNIIDGAELDSGIKIERKRVPLGVIGVIYEARPNVTVDVACLCLKTGNAAILRGGKETQYTNQILVEIIQQALTSEQLPAAAVQAITNPDRQLITQLLKLDQYIDMIIPRGGAALHQLCKEQSTIPVIVGGIGVCHLFVEQSANFDKSLTVIHNAKTQRPSTCNTLETLLVQESIAAEFLPKLATYNQQPLITFHADPQAFAILTQHTDRVKPLEEATLSQEWLSLDLNVVVVKDIDLAIAHIRQYGSQHSDGILSQNPQLLMQFAQQVDSAAVYLNASTRFTDGGEFGLGAEVAVSTQKLHARGPMGLEALTTYKWICSGDYAIRK